MAIDPWQRFFIHAGETKTISCPAGRMVEFGPITGTPNSGLGVRFDYGTNHVIEPVGLMHGAVSAPAQYLGPVTLSLILSKISPYTTAASWFLVMYRFKDPT